MLAVEIKDLLLHNSILILYFQLFFSNLLTNRTEFSKPSYYQKYCSNLSLKEKEYAIKLSNISTIKCFTNQHALC